MNRRDDFTARTIDIMAKCVGYRCSNPNCRKLTCGANDDPQEYTNIGVAAHICAAAPGGKRYDPSMTPEERKDIYNGIWLCQSCSKLIDSDDIRYTVDFLHKWKNLSEEAAILELESLSPSDDAASDIALMKFYLQCFDRPAFKDDIRQEGWMEDFDKAIEDTIIALNTGILRARDGYVLKKAEGKAFLHNQEWRDKFDAVVDILSAIRRRLKVAEADHSYAYRDDGQDGFYYFNDRRLAEWFNFSREELLRILASICDETGLRAPRFRRRHYDW